MTNPPETVKEVLDQYGSKLSLEEQNRVIESHNAYVSGK